VPSAPQPFDRPIRVLAIDDDISTLAILEAICKAERMDIATLADSSESLAKVEAVKPDVILLDVVMPVVDGFQVCESLKGNPKTQLIPVVLLTSLESRGHRIRGLQAGCDDFMTKPVQRLELTARVKSLARLRSLTLTLESTVSGLEHFAHVAAHDLKAPLRGIAQLTSWIDEDLGANAPPRVRDSLELLKGRTERMAKLIDAILEYSRAGFVAQATESLDVGALIREIVENQHLPPECKVELGTPMPTLRTQRIQFFQVLSNLIDNAARHGKNESTKILIRHRALEDSDEFEVADNGLGISEADQKRVFDPFWSQSTSGTGIGLALVKKLVEQHGGTIELKSSPGQGTTFTFTWRRGSSESFPPEPEQA